MAKAAIKTASGRGEAARLFVSAAPLSVVLVDLDGRFLAVSPVTAATAGIPAEAFVGRTIAEVYNNGGGGFETMRDALASGQSEHVVIRHVRAPDGAERWIKAQGSYWRDDSGAVVGILMVNQDVSSEHATERARRDLEVLLKAVVENIPATLAVYDPETLNPILVNGKAAELLGINSEDVGASPAVDYMGEDRLATLTRQFRDVDEAGGMTVSETEIARGPSAGRTMLVKRLTFEDAEGRRRLLSVGEDVTDLREATKALEAAVIEADAANAAKSDFLAHISHEIRTPLNGVLGMAQAMARDRLLARQRARLDVVRQSGETLLMLLNDILDLSKIEAGKLQIEEVEFDLAEVMRAACGSFRAIAETKGIAFEVRADNDLGRCRGDPTRLRQVLANLTSNAVKFTESGSIEVAAIRTGDRIRFSLADTGVGMTADAQSKLFQKFSQADVSTARRFGGTGLGLSICRELVEMMGGGMSVESAPGEGSRFSFDMVLPRLEEDGLSLKTAAPQEGCAELKILAAEDNQINQLVLRTLLEQVGAHVEMVNNGAEAVEAWRRQPWDVVLMDVQMPVMDGVTAVEAIRRAEMAEGRTRTPIIALTANAMTHQTADYLARGMDAVVAKPIQVQALIEAIAAFLPADVDDGALEQRLG